MELKDRLWSALGAATAFGVYHLLYWSIYHMVVFRLLYLQVEAMTVLDLIAIFVFLLTCVPAAAAIRWLALSLRREISQW